MTEKSLKFARRPLLAALALFCAGEISAIKDAKLEFQGWGGVNIATKSTFSTDFTSASFVKPTFGLTTWMSQSFIMPENLDFGLSVGYMPIFSQTAGTGTVTSVTAIPVILEGRYRFGGGIFAAAGAGYAYTALKVNDESTGTNAAIISLKGGYEYEIMKNLTAVGTAQASYLLQSITFAGAGKKSNSQANFSFTLGVGYKI
jgi:hypothetical protein